MNIIEKAIEKLEAEVDDLLRDDAAKPDKAAPAPAQARAALGAGGPAPTPARTEAAPGRATQGPDAREASIEVGVHMPPPAPEAPTARSERLEIDLQSLSVAGFVTPLAEETVLAEEFRIIKRPLLARATPGDSAYIRDGNLIIITSSLPGEGKTFNAVNLALSIAMEVDRTVLLIDADVAKSDLSRVFGLRGRKGLSSYLDGTERDLSRLLVRTNVDSLSVLPSGPRHPRITELLASAQMRALVAELSARYSDRIVLFDSSPILATSGASVLAGLMGQVIMIVEAVRTPQSAVREALRRIGPLSNVGVLFNKQRRMAQGYGYEYRYGYGYGPDGHA
jgi:receptor protein-tyrosine kinase